MAKCSRCGQSIGESASCPACGAPPSQSMLDKNINRVAHATGDVLDKSIDVGEKVVKETKPVVKRALDLGKKGVGKAKVKTREVAKSLKETE